MSSNTPLGASVRGNAKDAERSLTFTARLLIGNNFKDARKNRENYRVFQDFCLFALDKNSLLFFFFFLNFPCATCFPLAVLQQSLL